MEKHLNAFEGYKVQLSVSRVSFYVIRIPWIVLSNMFNFFYWSIIKFLIDIG